MAPAAAIAFSAALSADWTWLMAESATPFHKEVPALFVTDEDPAMAERGIDCASGWLSIFRMTG
jgi:hypothetical protein